MTIIHKPFFEHYHLNICEDGSKQIDKQKCSFQLCDIKLFDLSLKNRNQIFLTLDCHVIHGNKGFYTL